MPSVSGGSSFLIPPDDGALPKLPATAEERYAYALVLSRPWGSEYITQVSPTILVRESCQCQLLLYHGHFSDQAFARIQRPLGSEALCVLPGAGRHCHAWAGYTSELMVLPWSQFLGAGFGCFHCKRVARINPNMQKCVSCQFVRYCSSACQRAAWKNHKRACPGIGEAFQGALRREGSQVYYGFLQQDEWLRWVAILKSINDLSLPPNVVLYGQYKGKGKDKKGKNKGKKGRGKDDGKGKKGEDLLSVFDRF